MKMLNKRGISHIEVMLSFLIFIGFVIFALYFFSPIQTSRLVESSISYVFSEVKENVSVNMESYSISLNLAGIIEPTLQLYISGIGEEMSVRVEDYNGEPIPSKREGDFVFFSKNNVIYNDPKGFAIIKYSKDFSPASAPAEPVYVLPHSEYDFASSNTVKLISEKRILDLINMYGVDYNSLKIDFNLPGRIGFGFGIMFNETDKIETITNIPKGVEVFSDRERVEVLRINGEVKFADLIVEIW